MERVKGTTLSFTDYITERYGKGELAAFASGLRPEAARVILEGPVKSTWYTRDLYFHILIEFARRYARGNPAHLMRDISSFSAERDLNSIYRFFLKFGYPGYVLGKAAVLWQNYYDGGKMEIVAREKNGISVRLIDDVYLPYSCDLIIGFAERATTLSGGKDVKVDHPVCKHKGGPHCDFSVSWR
jgi:hypothetical protein